MRDNPDYRAANGRAQEARSTVVCLTTARPENRPLRRVVPTYASRAGAWPSVTAPTAATRRQRPMDRYPMHWYPYLSIGMDGVMEWTASWNGRRHGMDWYRMDWRPLRNNGYQTTTQRGGNGRGRRQAVPGRSLQCQQRQIVKDGEKMYRVGGPIADSGVVVQRFCQFKWKATLSVGAVDGWLR